MEKSDISVRKAFIMTMQCEACVYIILNVEVPEDMIKAATSRDDNDKKIDAYLKLDEIATDRLTQDLNTINCEKYYIDNIIPMRKV